MQLQNPESKMAEFYDVRKVKAQTPSNRSHLLVIDL